MIDNHIYFGNELKIKKVIWKRCADLNDRQEKTYTIKISASQFQAFKTGTNEIEIRSTENVHTDGNTELGEAQIGGLCRGSFTLFWGGYYNYN